MKHNLRISVSKEPQRGGIVQCRNISIREKLLTRLLGRKQKVMILIPGNTVSTVSITEVQEGGVVHPCSHGTAAWELYLGRPEYSYLW